MKTFETLHEHIAAAFTGLWVQSYEHEDALAEIGRLCVRHDWPLAVWDIDRDRQVRGQSVGSASDPVAAIKSTAALATNDDTGSAIFVLPNFHRFICSAEVVQVLAGPLRAGPAGGRLGDHVPGVGDDLCPDLNHFVT